MLAFCTSPSEISLVLGPSDARWLSEEMSFLTELYRSKAGNSERQFGGDNNVALTSFLETAAKCQQLSIALQQAIRRGYHREDDRAQHADASLAMPAPALASPSPLISSSPVEPPTRTKRVRRTAKPHAATKKKDSEVRSGRKSKAKRDPAG
jgi:hypothetical protein